MSTPIISIILPTYNGSKYLKLSIDSVLQESFKDFELIIINDASTDTQVEKIILDFQSRDPRIHYVKNEVNLKLTKTLNRGIALSKGKYIARIDDDDIWQDTQKLAKQLDFLDKNEDYVLIGTGAIQIDANGNEIGEIPVRETDMEIRKGILFSNQFIHSSVMIRKSALDLQGSYNPNWNYVEDYELWLRLGVKYKFCNLTGSKIKYRVLQTSITRQKNFQQQMMILKLIWANRYKYPRSIVAGILRLGIICMPQKIVQGFRKKWF